VETQISEKVIGAAIEVHRNLGPGLLESVYEECLCYELSQQGLKFQRQVEVPVLYKGVKLDCGYRLDLLVEDLIIVEIKSTESLLPVFAAQLLTYLKICRKRIGLLINFNVPILRNGLKRVANNYEEPLRLCVSASNPILPLTEIPQESL
jgi:GxxExxY protein